MNTNELLKRLTVQLKQLEQAVLTHDANLPKREQKLLQDVDRFNSELFIQSGAKLAPCIEQIGKSISQLEKLIKGKMSTSTIALSCERIQNRFSAVRRALSTTSLGVKSAANQKAFRIATAKKRRNKFHDESGFNWIAAGVMHNSHQLYEELNKHLNWVSTFEQKILNLQFKLDSCHSADKIQMQNEILLVHRRLGKCRQAISYIEDRIQAFERPFSQTYKSFNR
ncbi:primosomal replication protein [Shewanella eurypsychrophilus]|uniref:Primosomal replication protein n=1 Tax=Shewanella eurypsychrophilus TaxID=2593656 RepID=A0ABX6VA22_9GAMM|nr:MULTISPECIES: primosomal replication protein [Shewanella]QFU22051.1 prepilin peptidase [Shewanella sp. YLB-09]QPG57340.1 primosomal replication protein [Shewanella eurypsychrophilus]